MNIKEKLSLVPELPGSYQMLDKNGIIIYVGKAKNLKKRVSSYFNREHTGKTAKLVENIYDFKYIVANSEVEAFLIEINLIKKYKPKYNISLMDAKSYPYIEYISKPYPKLKISRYLNVKRKDNKMLFGPYPNAYAARRIVNLINRLYPLKKCENKKELCLYYHIGECLGYCSKDLNQNKVKEMEKEILSFLRGNDKILKNKIMDKIKIYSDNLNYEMAASLKEELNYINIVMEKQKIDLTDLKTRDVFGFYYKDGYMSVNVFYVRNGKLVGSKNDIYLCLDEEDACEYYIAEFYTKHEIPNNVLVSSNLNKKVLESVVETKFITPLKGVKKGLLDMAILNAKINYDNKFKLLEKEDERTLGSNEKLKELLKLPKLSRIDLFDNSNLFGTFAVSAMVVFINGKPAKKEYRKYKIIVDKNDDYHTMQEVIYRRYNKAMIENLEMPDLILVDGGLIQMHAAKSVLDDLGLNIAVAGLKKDNKHNTNSLIDLNEEEIPLDVTSNLFHYLTRMQDEVHRFAISYHRQIRSKGQIASVLDNVANIGEKRRKELIKKFKTITNIKNATIEELSTIIPESTAINLKEYLKSLEDNNENN